MKLHPNPKKAIHVHSSTENSKTLGQGPSNADITESGVFFSFFVYFFVRCSFLADVAARPIHWIREAARLGMEQSTNLPT